jgi:predicted phage terminase large subunit-like protein
VSGDLLDWETLTDVQKQAVKALCEHDFLTFQRIFWQFQQSERMEVNWHSRYVAAKVEKVIGGSIKNLAINVPPGSGKTEQISIALPAYCRIETLKSGIRARFLNLSYADSLVKRNSKRVRDMIKSPEFTYLWPSTFGTDSAEEWILTDNKGKSVFEMVSKSTGGQVTGSRGGFPGPRFSGAIILDDPSKPTDMISSVKRDSANHLLVDTIRSRRGDKSEKHPTPIILIQQRLHQLDATGFVMAGHMGMKFDMLKVPALIDDEYIQSLPDFIRDVCWNDIKDSEEINGYRSFWPKMEGVRQLFDLWESNEYTFMSQYMQAPIALGGQIFHSEWWKWYGDQEGCDEGRPITFEWRFITGDTAMKTGERNDFSVLMCWGVWQNKLYLLDVLRGKWEAPELRTMFINFVMKHWALNTTGNHGILRSVHIEDKASGTGLLQEAGRHLPLPLTAVQRGAGQNKTVRARDAAPQIKMGNVLLPMGEPWIMDFVTEHSQFTEDDSHDHDDMVDNTSDAVQIAITRPGQSCVNMLLTSRQRNRAG